MSMKLRRINLVLTSWVIYSLCIYVVLCWSYLNRLNSHCHGNYRPCEAWWSNLPGRGAGPTSHMNMSWKWTCRETSMEGRKLLIFCYQSALVHCWSNLKWPKKSRMVIVVTSSQDDSRFQHGNVLYPRSSAQAVESY